MMSRLAFIFLASLLCAGLVNAQVAGSGTIVASGSIRGFQGSPFSADVISQHSRVLADGNRIDQETHGKLYRDSQGRTRMENENVLPTGKRYQHISIHDPQQRVTLSLDPNSRTARILHFPVPAMPTSLTSPPMPPEEERPRTSHTAEGLGHMTIEGIDAIGTRITRTIPANVIGNAQALVTVTETWRSPELNENLLVKISDPQNGDDVRKLVNIQRGEPDPTLFQIPPDYKILDTSPPQ